MIIRPFAFHMSFPISPTSASLPYFDDSKSDSLIASILFTANPKRAIHSTAHSFISHIGSIMITLTNSNTNSYTPTNPSKFFTMTLGSGISNFILLNLFLP